MMQKNNTDEDFGWIQRILTRIVRWNGKMNEYNRATDRQRRAIASSAVQSWVLTKLDTEKTKATENPAIAKRLAEVKFLHENKFITDDEYEAKQSEILRQL